MLCQIFIFVEHFGAYLAHECLFDYTVHGPLMAFQINFEHISSCTIVYRATGWRWMAFFWFQIEERDKETNQRIITVNALAYMIGCLPWTHILLSMEKMKVKIAHVKKQKVVNKRQRFQGSFRYLSTINFPPYFPLLITLHTKTRKYLQFQIIVPIWFFTGVYLQIFLVKKFKKKKKTSEYFFDWSIGKWDSKITRICCLLWFARPNSFEHISQTYGLTPKCAFMCSVILVNLWNLAPQNEQMNRLLSVCVTIWCLRLDLSANEKLQIWHTCFSTMPCTVFKCLRNNSCWRNVSSQPSCVQVKSFIGRLFWFVDFDLVIVGFGFVSTPPLLVFNIGFRRGRFLAVFGFIDSIVSFFRLLGKSFGMLSASTSKLSSVSTGSFKILSAFSVVESIETLSNAVNIFKSFVSVSPFFAIDMQCEGRCSSNSTSPIKMTKRLQSVQFLWTKCVSTCSLRSDRVEYRWLQITQSYPNDMSSTEKSKWILHHFSHWIDCKKTNTHIPSIFIISMLQFYWIPSGPKYLGSIRDSYSGFSRRLNNFFCRLKNKWDASDK